MDADHQAIMGQKPVSRAPRQRVTRDMPDARLDHMNARVDHLLDEALLLPTDQRCALVVALLDSIESTDDPSVSEAWRIEILRRKAGLRDGSLHAMPWAEAKAILGAL